MRRRNGLFYRIWYVLFGESALDSGCRQSCDALRREIEEQDAEIDRLAKMLDEKNALIDEAMTMLDVGISVAGQHSEVDRGFCNGLRFAKSLLDGKEPEYFSKVTPVPESKVVTAS